jgi:hypothetical protein
VTLGRRHITVVDHGLLKTWRKFRGVVGCGLGADGKFRGVAPILGIPESRMAAEQRHLE